MSGIFSNILLFLILLVCLGNLYFLYNNNAQQFHVIHLLTKIAHKEDGSANISVGVPIKSNGPVVEIPIDEKSIGVGPIIQDPHGDKWIMVEPEGDE